MLLAVPNASEGRDPRVIDAIADAFAGAAGVALLDRHSDGPHGRSVFTLGPQRSGEAEDDVAADLGDALLAGARACAELIDMRAHQGVHPCIGALDVCPVIFTAPASREAAIDLARGTGRTIAESLDLPVFFYGELARAPERAERAYFRAGGLATLVARMAAGELRPDAGPAEPHPTAGATLVTARPPLAAFNMKVEGCELDGVIQIAAMLREAGGGLPGVRAIGLDLGEAGLQLSVNVHDPLEIPLAEVVAEASALALPHGGRIVAAEIVGLVPRAALEGFPGEVPLVGFDAASGVIENRVGVDGDQGLL